MMRPLPRAASFGCLLAITIGAPAGARADEDAKLASFFQAYLDAAFRAQPLVATRTGDHRFDDQLDDLSADARAANEVRDRRTLAELPSAVAYDRLSRNGQIDYEIVRHHLEREVWLAENFRPFEDDPRVYGDYLTESVYLLLTQSSLPRAVNLRNALGRMARIPAVVDIARRTIKAPPRVKTETAIRQTRGAIAFYESDLFRLAGEPNDKGQLAETARRIVGALRAHLRFLEVDVLPRSTEAWRIGPDRFARKLDLELDAAIPADEVVRTARQEAERVQREMAVVARQLWGRLFPQEAVPPDRPESNRTLVRRVLAETGKDCGTPQGLVDDVRATVRDIKQFIAGRDILRLPEPDRLRIIEMPEFQRGNSVAYLNPAPPLDPRGTSEYAISPPPSDWPPERVTSFLREYNHAMLKVLTIHEAYPGHYVQLEYSNRCPSLVRKVLASGTFAEGWAVYTEQTMLDQGFGGGDLTLRLNQLKFYLRAVDNAILDHEMHAGRMTDEQALDLLMNHGYQTEGEAVGKIIRAKQTSCQLSTYFVGRTAFDRLRQRVQRAQGDRFTIGRFHEAVLAHGTVPVKYLPELVGGALE